MDIVHIHTYRYECLDKDFHNTQKSDVGMLIANDGNVVKISPANVFCGCFDVKSSESYIINIITSCITYFHVPISTYMKSFSSGFSVNFIAFSHEFQLLEEQGNFSLELMLIRRLRVYASPSSPARQSPSTTRHFIAYTFFMFR